jgi:hypothetical protein
MGRFHASVANDAFAPWWNPGGLAFMRGWHAGLMHTKLVPDLADDVYYEYAGISKYLKGWGGVAATLTYLNYGESIETTQGSPTELGRFSSFEISPSLAIGTEVVRNLGLGANLKFIHVDLASGSSQGDLGVGSTFGVDVGALYRVRGDSVSLFGSRPGESTLGIGLTVANLGPDISLSDTKNSDPLPRNVKLGLSYGMRVPQSYSFLLGGSVEKSLVFEDIADSVKSSLSIYEKEEIILSGGAEFGILDMVFGRVGYIYDDPGEIKGMTYGAGFYLKQFGLDVASIPQFRELDRVTKFSLVARF